jgi:RNA polymerase sigma-70 factor (ECF subfamily)
VGEVVERTHRGICLTDVVCTADDAQAAQRPRPATKDAATADEVFALVYRQMRRLAGPRDVDELAQIAAEQAIRSLPTFEGRSQLATWTFRICYLSVRKHDRWYRRWLRRFTLTVDGELPERVADDVDADERLSRSERLVRLQAALARLSPKRRAVLVLHDLEGLSIDRIAEVVGASPAAVRSRLRDGRKTLASLLSEDPYFGDLACSSKERP